MLIEIDTFALQKIHLKMWSGKWRAFCPGLNVLNDLRKHEIYFDVLSFPVTGMVQVGWFIVTMDHNAFSLYRQSHGFWQGHL